MSQFAPYFLNAFCTSSLSYHLFSLLPPCFPVVFFLYSHQNGHLKSYIRACRSSALNLVAFCISLRVEAEVLAMVCKTLQGLLLFLIIPLTYYSSSPSLCFGHSGLLYTLNTSRCSCLGDLCADPFSYRESSSPR